MINNLCLFYFVVETKLSIKCFNGFLRDFLSEGNMKIAIFNKEMINN